LHQEVVEARAATLQEFMMLQHFFSNKTLWDGKEVHYDDYCWARNMVSSRWFGVSAEGGSSAINFKVTGGYAFAEVVSNTSYHGHHMVPFLDLMNHHIVDDPQNKGYFAEVSEWVRKNDTFELKVVRHGEVDAGDEVFITYGARGINEMLIHYGFLHDIRDDFYQPSIFVAPRKKDPLYELKLRCINKCWPGDVHDWVPVQPQYMPVENYQRALIIVEKRRELLTNVTYVKEYFCKSTGIFTNRDIESLRRNKRAILYLLDKMKRSFARSQTLQVNEALLKDPKTTYNMRNMVIYRQKARDNLETSIRNFISGNLRLLKEISIAPGHVQTE
jgi:hypothetical protein